MLPFGNFAVLSLVIYLAPGLAIDAFFLLSRHKACCLACCMSVTAIANAVGTALVGSIFLALPGIFLLFSCIVAALTGSVGGYLSNMLLFRIRKIGFFPLTIQESKIK
jgi:hypothetical protein